MEIINPNLKRGQVRTALFDFDGTLSLIREGWEQVMIPMMVDLLQQTPAAEGPSELEAIVAGLVSRTTGRQTIYQMINLAEEIEKRGGLPRNPLVYKRMYLDRLGKRIQSRLDALESGRVSAETMMVPGARAVLQAMQTRGVTCYLASGTDEPYVRAEAAALGIAPYFAGIYGAQDNYKQFSKRLVIERLLAQNNLQGHELVAFGDGFVEIEETKRVGGLAVGVASNEATRTGLNAWKRTRLLKAGADIIIPDFREHNELPAFLNILNRVIK